MQALRRGHVYIGDRWHRLAAVVPVHGHQRDGARPTRATCSKTGGPVTLRVRSNAPSSFLTMLWRDGELLDDGA